ncbi:hemin ABC transporter substrate-binding protein [Gemmobacter nanjingensis]|uniref:Hemin ABC transporter substrate-binding protein n=1 Tax=Gemmobacter nanjingensis TaxID=488454 RepID=A0ABQ3FJN7_9RHOB|nr:ABC transporter substrate-binding protein [Gemmobacter nanjingensis]GHC26651.1 hemin ABC transporter substrate-binding protein [Gemmobacter nanjingensis]
MKALTLSALLLASPALAGGERVITLGGSVTEIAVALGAQDRLVARDTTSNFPPEIEALPDVGYIRALSAEGVLSLDPDLIVAEGDAGPQQAVDVLKAAGVPFVLVPEDPTPQGIADKITAVAAALDMPEAGAALAAQVQDGLAAAEARAAAVTDRKRVLFILSLQGGRIMAGGEGTEAEGIIRLAGGENAATGFQGYKQIADEAVLTAAPDLILMMAREGDLSIADADILAHPALAETPAARNGALVRMDGMLLLGFGPRTPEAARALYDALYGQAEG